MKQRPTSRLALPIAIMIGFALANTAANAQGTFTDNGATLPTFDGADQGYFDTNSPSTSTGQDKWFYENSGAGQPKGQTFTVTSPVEVKAMSYRLKATNKPPTVNYLVRIGAVDTATNTFFPLHSETITQTTNWGILGVTTDSIGTWTLASPVTLPALPAGTVYGFDLTMTSNTTAWQQGIPYPLFTGNVFAGGNMYSTPLGGASGVPTNTMNMNTANDREFHLDMDATTITDTTKPTLTSIDDQVGGGPIYEDQVQVTYILNFDEAIDASTIDLADFENAFPGSGVSIDSVVSVQNTTPYPIASVVKVVLGISGTGTLKLGVKSGSDIADFAATPNLVNSPVADDNEIIVNAGTNPGGGNRWWDGTIITGITDGVSQGGAAIWDTDPTNTNWDRGFGFAGPVAWNNASGNTAIFGGTAGTVTLAEDITLNGLTVSLPIAGGSGYSIGEGGENNTLNFPALPETPGLVTVTATGNGSNQDTIIRAGIAGEPTMNIAGRNDNNANSFQLLPGADVTQTIGTLNMLNTLGSNKRLILGGESTGNVVGTVTWSVTGNQMFLTKLGAGDWTITNDLALSGRAARLYVEQGTLTLGGTNHFFTHKVGVATVIGTGFTPTNLASKLIAKGTFTIGDNREYFYVQNAGTLSPGPGVETLTVRWNANNNAATTHGQFNMQTGSTYEWDVASSISTDVIDVQRGGSSVGNLILGNMTIKVNDAGVSTDIAAGDQLTVFTYQTGVTRSIGTVTIDTTSLGAGWSGTPSLVDDGAGTIYLTGLSKSAGPASPYDTWATGFGLQNPWLGVDPLLNGEAGANPDGDAFTNLQEFAFAFNPTVSDGSGPLTISGGAITQNGPPQIYVDPVTGQYFLRYTRRADYVAAGLTYTAQFAADSLGAGSFEDVAGGSVVGTGTGAGGVAIEAVAIEFPDALPVSGKKARFGRVEVTQTP